MTLPRFDSLQIGSELPPLSLPPLNRTTLALYAGGSGDHVPLHIDIDYARRAGMPDVFGHGMLTAAWLGRMLTGWVRQDQLRKFAVRFVGIAHLGNQIRCKGRIVEKFEAGGEKLARIEIAACNQYDEMKVVGEIVVALP